MPVRLTRNDDDRQAGADGSGPRQSPPGLKRFFAIVLFTLILLVPVAIFTALRG